jgi:hypothetical protein
VSEERLGECHRHEPGRSSDSDVGRCLKLQVPPFPRSVRQGRRSECQGHDDGRSADSEVGLKVLDLRGHFFHFGGFFAIFDRKSNFQKRRFAGKPSNFQFQNTCFLDNLFRMGYSTGSTSKREFSIDGILAAGNGGERGSCDGTTKGSAGETALRSTERIAESNRHRSRERVISLPLQPKVEVVMKSSLSPYTLDSLPTGMYLQSHPTGMYCTYNRILRACTVLTIAALPWALVVTFAATLTIDDGRSGSEESIAGGAKPRTG